MIKKIRLIARIFLYFVMSLVIGVAVYLFNAKVLLGNTLPMPFDYGVGVVITGSMEPQISVDDVILVKKTYNYEIGDIVVYQIRDILIVHKIISIDGEYVVTKGIANDASDEKVAISDLKGKVIKVYEGRGEMITFIQSPFGVILIISIVLLLLVLVIESEKKEKQKEIEKLKEEIKLLKNANE